MTTNEFYVAIVLIHTARLLDKRLDRRVLIELSSGARFDRAFAGVGSGRAVLGWRLGRKIVGCDERDCREAEEDTSAHCIARATLASEERVGAVWTDGSDGPTAFGAHDGA